MPITFVGPSCARRGCRGPAWKDQLCPRCWRLAGFLGRDPRMFAYEPADGYSDDRDAVALPWSAWDEEARTRGGGVADLFARPSADDRSTR